MSKITANCFQFSSVEINFELEVRRYLHNFHANSTSSTVALRNQIEVENETLGWMENRNNRLVGEKLGELNDRIRSKSTV